MNLIMMSGLYLGEVGHEYLIEEKKTEEQAEALVPRHCIYHGYNFDPEYIQNNPKPTGYKVLTYDHAFWESPLAQSVWAECFDLLNLMNIDFTFNYWTEVFIMINGYNHRNKDMKSNIKQVIKINIFL